MSAPEKPCRVFLIAGEHSGDLLGGKLIAALKCLSPGTLELQGVGGEAMAEQGCPSLFPMSEVAVMGPAEIIPRLPMILKRISQTSRAVIDARPDALVILDSPEFTHPIARRVRRRLPDLPIIDYVSPSVWAWRPGRARKMRRYIDHVLAILPFEPAAHKRLGGPACTYVGHPLIEQMAAIRNCDAAPLSTSLNLADDVPVLVVLPGSRPNEVKRLMQPFGDALNVLLRDFGPLQVIVPTVSSVRSLVEERCAGWPLRPHLIEGQENKFKAFRRSRAALAASGTVTLELAVSGTPMVVAYRVEPLAVLLRWLVKVPSIVLPNLILEENVFPELIQEDCTGEKLAAALLPLLRGGPERERQLTALQGLADRMTLREGTPSEKAAEIVLRLARHVE